MSTESYTMSTESYTISFASRDEALTRLCQKVFGATPVFADDAPETTEIRCEFCNEKPLTSEEKAHMAAADLVAAASEASTLSERPTPITDKPVSLREAADRPRGTISLIHQYDADACCRRFEDLERQLAASNKEREDNGKLAHDLSIELNAHSKALERASRAIDELMTQRDTLADALRFYADKSKYPAPFTGGFGALYYDCGQVADAALATLNSETPTP